MKELDLSTLLFPIPEVEIFDEISYLIGVVRPGGQGVVGTLTLSTYTQAAAAKIDIDVSFGTLFTSIYVTFVVTSTWVSDRLVVTGNVSLAGTISTYFLNPPSGGFQTYY